MKVWTFKIVGGEPIQISIPRVPVLNHTGGTTLWQMFGPPEWADAIEGMLKASGCKIERYGEGQTDEQEVGRMFPWSLER